MLVDRRIATPETNGATRQEAPLLGFLRTAVDGTVVIGTNQAAYLLAPQSWEGLRLEFCDLVDKSIDAGAELAKPTPSYAPR